MSSPNKNTTFLRVIPNRITHIKLLRKIATESRSQSTHRSNPKGYLLVSLLETTAARLSLAVKAAEIISPDKQDLM